MYSQLSLRAIQDLSPPAMATWQMVWAWRLVGNTSSLHNSRRETHMRLSSGTEIHEVIDEGNVERTDDIVDDSLDTEILV